MEASDLLEIFGTLSVGALVVGIFVTFWWIIRRPDKSLREFVKGRGLRPENAVSVTLVTVLTFGLGIFVEGLTDFMTDSESVKDYTSKTLGKESLHRFDTLFKEDEANPRRLRLRTLGRELFRQKHFTYSVLTNLAFLENPDGYVNMDLGTNEVEKIYGLNPNGKDKSRLSLKNQLREQAEGYVNALYYPAKNWAYMQDNYYDELEKIQRRIDWSRSSSLVTLILSIFGLLVYLVLALSAWIFSKTEQLLSKIPGAQPVIQKVTELRTHSRLRAGRVLTVVCVVTVTWPCMKLAYAHSEEQFNERVFGYYISYLQRSTPPLEPATSNKSRLFSLAWFQTAAEYRALCLQTFEAARQHTLAALDKPESGNRPPAVVLDIDETVLDNSAFNSFLEERGLTYSESLWLSWANIHSGSVVAVPGAVSFVQAMRQTNVAVIFITNRDAALSDVTVKRMSELGFGSPEQLLANSRFRIGSSSSKEERRQKVEAEFRILTIVGDNLADFADDFEAAKTTSAHERWDRVTQPDALNNWGRKWFVLPNPLYGDWEREVQWDKVFLYSKELRVGGNH